MSYECDSCTRCFASSSAKIQHMNDTGHHVYECETCYFRGRTQHAVEQHMATKDHYSYNYQCPICDVAYRFEHGLEEHQARNNHYKSRWCKPCNRGFNSEHNLAQHLRSAIHVGRQIPCPGCQTMFATRTGVAHHIETSACPKARHMDRIKLHSILRQFDTNGAFTENLLEWHDSAPELDQSWNASSAWNGWGYECYVCHREFSLPQGLKQHITSPVHQQSLYHCLNRTCDKRTTSFAAWLNHLESESCGYKKFAQVQRQVDHVFTGRNLLAY